MNVVIRSGHRSLVATLLFLSACSGSGGYRELSDPVTVDDFEPLPAAITKGNARLVIRRCLQIHRRSSATLDSEFGYAFGEGGFVQLYHLRTLDRADERTARVYVGYAAIASVGAEPHYNLMRLREEFRVTLKGAFRKWESHVRSFQAEPDLGAEVGKLDVDSLILTLDDAVVSNRLVQALAILSAR